MKGKTHTIKYRYTCEKCGKTTDWYSVNIEEETEVYGAAEVVSSIVDKNRFSRQLQKFKEKVEGGVYDYHFYGGTACPFCRNRQSWMPAVVSFMSPAARIVLYMCGWVFIGIALHIATRIWANKMDILEWLAYDGWLLCILGAPLIGLALAIRRNKINSRKNKEHESTVTVRNKPEIDWNGA